MAEQADGLRNREQSGRLSQAIRAEAQRTTTDRQGDRTGYSDAGSIPAHDPPTLDDMTCGGVHRIVTTINRQVHACVLRSNPNELGTDAT